MSAGHRNPGSAVTSGGEGFVDCVGIPPGTSGKALRKHSVQDGYSRSRRVWSPDIACSPRRVTISLSPPQRVRTRYDPLPSAAFFSKAGIMYWDTKRSYSACTSGVTVAVPMAPSGVVSI